MLAMFFKALYAAALLLVSISLVSVTALSDCVGPYSAEFAECEERISWLMNNWATIEQQYYVERGVDESGSRCSIQKYLHSVENYCPDCSACSEDTTATTAAPAVTQPPVQSTCTGPYPAAEYDECEGRINYIMEHWDNFDTSFYTSRGVDADGSRCSIQ